MKAALLGHYRKFRVLRLLIVLALVITSSSFAGAFVADAPHLLKETVKTGVNGTPDGSIASAYENNPAVNLSAGETSGILHSGQGVGGAPSYANRSIWLGDFNGSYLQPVYIPVYTNDMGTFEGLNQTFSYDSKVLSFSGTVNDVASQKMTFSFSTPVPDMIRIFGVGAFLDEFPQTTLYYLIFQPIVQNQTKTSVLLDSSTLGNSTFSNASQGIVKLVEGWKNLGPSNLPFSLSSGSTTSYSGNGSGVVDSIGFSPFNNSVIYAGSGSSAVEGHGGVFKSKDGGKTWSSVDLGINPHFTKIEGIAVFPENTSDVVVSADGFLSGGVNDTGAIYKSINGGASWQVTYLQGGNYLHYNGSSNLLYASTPNSIIVSSNFGSSWSVVFSIRIGQIVGACIVAPGKSTEIAVLNGSIVSTYISNNNGRSFNLTGNFPASGSVHFAVDPSNYSIQYYQEFAGYSYPGLFKSLNGGFSWTQVNMTQVNYTIDTNYAPQFVAYDPVNSSIIYVGGDLGVEVSYDGGLHFIHSGLVADTRDIEVDSLNGNVYVGSDQGLFKSTDNGQTWTALNNRSSSLSFGVAVSGENALVTLGDFGPYMTHNNGTAWSGMDIRNQLPPGTPGLRAEGGIAVTDPYDNSIILYAAGYMAISLNGGLTYQLPSINQTGVDNFQALEPAGFAFTSNDTVYYAGNLGLFVSHDSGLSWNVLNGSPKDVYEIQLGDSEGKEIYVLNSTGVLVSDDYGHIWDLVSRAPLLSFSLDPFNHSIIAGIERSAPGGGYFGAVLSLDGGKSFSYAGVEGLSPWNWVVPNTEISFLNTSSGLALVFTSGYGVYTSFDLGKTWLNLNYNLPTVAVTSFEVYGDVPYITTLGSGVWYDPSLFNLNFTLNKPLLTGYIPPNTTVAVNGIQENLSGYFSICINQGNNTIDWEGEKLSLTATGGGVYFFNFSNMQSNMQIFLKVKEKNLPVGTEWNIFANGRSYSIMGNGSLTLSPSTSGIYVLPVATDYSIYYPSNNFYPLNSSPTSSITVQFDQSVRAVYRNVSSSMNGMFWSTQIAYNRGYILYAGGTVGLLNVTSDEGQRLQSPDYSGTADSAVPFGTGFLVGGSASPDRPGIYYYNISTGIFTNYSTLFPATWKAGSSMISEIFEMNSSAFGFIGGGVDSAYFGVIDGGRFTDLSSYLPSSFTPSNGWYDRYSGGYLSSYQGFVLSDGTDIGIFYLQNKSFHDISQLMPSGFFVGMTGNEWSPSSDFISSNGTTAIITGVDNMRQFTVLYNPDMGIKDISALFPSSEYMDTVTWQGRDIVLSGYESNGNSSSIFIYNTTRQIPTAINTTYYGNTSIVDSAVMAGNSVYFTTFNVKTVSNETYVIYLSYYGVVKLTPTGCINVKVNTPSSIEINNETYFATSASVPEFIGNYTLAVSSPGYVSYFTTVDVSPFEYLYLNITLEPKFYGITFTENGLPSGVSWSVTLNGTTKSSSSSNITFLVPNGTYSYSIAPISGYTILSMPGYNETTESLTVNGYNLSYPVTFLHNNEGYFVVTVYPVNATLYINGTAYQRTGILVSTPAGNNGGGAVEFFNISLAPGTYQVKITATGYHTYTTTITMSSQLTPIYRNYTLEEISSHSSFPLLYAAFAAVIVVIVAITTVILLRRRGRKR